MGLNITPGNGDISANIPFFVNPTTIIANYTIPTGKNVMTAGPVTIADEVTVTVADGSEWTIV